jgi:RimJ/RimL family protein N-acetyltransferase
MQNIKFRKASIADCDLYFEWANDPLVREQSFSTEIIQYDQHVKWFQAKIEHPDIIFLIFENAEKKNIGQVRIQKTENHIAIIGVSVSIEFRGKGMASKMLQQSSDYFLDKEPLYVIHAFIKTTNKASVNSFIKAGYSFEKELIYLNAESYLYIKRK